MRVTLERADGATVTLDCDLQDRDSLERLIESARDPMAQAKELAERERLRHYWQERCLEAEARLNAREPNLG